MILVIDTAASAAYGEKLAQMLETRGKDYELVRTEGMNISHCVGCNYCWLKTPGICCIEDDYEPILKKMIDADKLLLIGDTSLGFVSYKAKNIMDRIMPLLLMYLEFRKGKMRHRLRYDGRMDFGLIYNGDADREFMEEWCQRVADNIDSKSLGAYPADKIEEVAACM